MRTKRAFKRFSFLVLLFAFILFLHGFFPLKRSVSGFATKTSKQFCGQNITHPDKRFHKVVVMLIDALRADFVFERNLMPFMKTKLVKGKGRSFTLRAHPPTVTLPRIKVFALSK